MMQSVFPVSAMYRKRVMASDAFKCNVDTYHLWARAATCMQTKERKWRALWCVVDPAPLPYNSKIKVAKSQLATQSLLSKGTMHHELQAIEGVVGMRGLLSLCRSLYDSRRAAC